MVSGASGEVAWLPDLRLKLKSHFFFVASRSRRELGYYYNNSGAIVGQQCTRVDPFIAVEGQVDAICTLNLGSLTRLVHLIVYPMFCALPYYVRCFTCVEIKNGI